MFLGAASARFNWATSIFKVLVRHYAPLLNCHRGLGSRIHAPCGVGRGAGAWIAARGAAMTSWVDQRVRKYTK